MSKNGNLRGSGSTKGVSTPTPSVRPVDMEVASDDTRHPVEARDGKPRKIRGSQHIEAGSNFQILQVPTEHNHLFCSTQKFEILLMDKNPAKQLRLVALSHYLQGILHPRWCRISSISRSGLVDGI